MLDRIRDLLAGEQELHIDDVAQFYSEQREEKMAELQEKADSIREQVEKDLESLDSQLEDIEGYKDPEGRTRVEDVTQNIYTKRKSLINDLDLPENPAELHQQLTSFMDQFLMLKEKEKAVLKQGGVPADDMFARAREVGSRSDELRTFIQEEYSTVTRYERVKDLLSTIDRLEEDIRGLESDISDIDVQDLRGTLEEKKEDLREIENDDRWDQIDELRDRIAEHQEQLQRVKNTITEPFSRMERGAKKLIYSAENDDLSLAPEHVQALKTVRDGTATVTDDILAAVDPVRDAVTDNDLLDGRYRDRFLEALDQLDQVPDRRERKEELEGLIETVEEKIQEIAIQDEKEQLQQEIQEIKDQIAGKKDEKTRLQDKIAQKREAIKDRIGQLEQTLNEEFRDRITVRYDRS